jgi:ribose transport system permease protein
VPLPRVAKRVDRTSGSDICAGLAGVIFSARVISAQPTAGTGYELEAIAAVVLGGTSLTGGRGRIVGTLIGSYMSRIVQSGNSPNGF